MESKMPEEWKWAKGGKSFLRALDPHLTSNKSLTFNLQKKKKSGDVRTLHDGII